MRCRRYRHHCCHGSIGERIFVGMCLGGVALLVVGVASLIESAVGSYKENSAKTAPDKEKAKLKKQLETIDKKCRQVLAKLLDEVETKAGHAVAGYRPPLELSKLFKT